MAFRMPEGVEVDLDAAFPDDTSTGSSSVSSEENIDYHQEAYPRYKAPHKRGHNVQPGDEFVNFKNRDPRKGPDPDKVMGAENDKFQRLKVRTNFALAKQDRDILVPDFPGIYFHSADNVNHDHPKSHVVTQIGTRFLQRKIQAGSNVLDVYGNPNACERFQVSQANADDPKRMRALVYNFGHSDYIREVNKYGPVDGPDGTRYEYGKLSQFVASGSVAEYNVLQFIHTLYYVNFAELNDALHAPCTKGTRTAVALIHRHEGQKGTINYGEQRYEKKRGLVKQVNVATNSTYVHPDITPLIFGEKKYWYPSEGPMFADGKHGRRVINDGRKGFTWDVNIVNKDTWMVQIVPCTRPDDQDDGLPDDIIDYEELWDEYEEQELVDTPSYVSSEGPTTTPRSMMLPMPDGRVIELDFCSEKLLSILRVSCIGKARDSKLLSELVNQARHLVNPSTLFGAATGVPCPEDKLYDHVIGALYYDVAREKSVLEATAAMGPLLESHARSLGLGTSIIGLKYQQVFEAVRRIVGGARKVNQVLSAKDLIDAGLSTLEHSMS